MKTKSSFSYWLLLLIIEQISALSFNQPKFCPNASWNATATTFADSGTIGSGPFDIFITEDNTIYIPNRNKGQIIIWSNGSLTPTRNISSSPGNLYSLFVTTTGDIYAYTYNWNTAVSKWTSNSTVGIPTMYTCQFCWDLFVDISNTLYCSMLNIHQVVTKSLNNASNAFTIVAGTGTPGNTMNMLNRPWGIFVDVNFDLYVADCNNNRIQLFRSGQLNGTTKAGNGASGTITLNCPTAIVLDADKHLFIVDGDNHRIVGSDSNGFRCLVGCSGGGSASNQLNYSRSLSFDSYGNIFVIDSFNNRVQKFTLTTGLCNTTTETITSTLNSVQHSSTGASNPVTMNPLAVISYNRPKFDALATWNPNAITFAANNTVRSNPYGIFINSNNTVYVTVTANNRIQIWLNDSINPTSMISGNLNSPWSIFVTINGDAYIDNGNSNGRVDKWISNMNSSVVAMNVNKACYGLFVDINNVLYCSMTVLHQVVAKSLNSVSDALTIVAGTGCSGSRLNMLNLPQGIFVNIKLDLYVADTQNNRIQLFRSDKLDAATVAGNGAPGTIALNYPTGVVLDADEHLFIVDGSNSRIVGQGPNGYRCLVGCFGSGAASNSLNNPRSMAFDSYGNIFVTDYNNNRVQKFLLLNNTFARSYNQPKFCPSTTWNPDAITFATNNTVGSYLNGMFVNTDNTVYVANRQYDQIQIWLNNSTNSTRTIFANLSSPYSIFVTINGDIYVDNGYSNGRVEKWSSETNTSVLVMSNISSCAALFIDISNILYCSINVSHKVVKRWLDDNSTTLTTVAGTGSSGNASNMLSKPQGIFVDVNFDLYVADYGNHRIQRFHLAELNGTTVAGSTSLNITISLNYPRGIVLDADKYLFIVDSGNNRIVGSGPTGFRCLVGCDRSNLSSNTLNIPTSLSFDSYGNMFVIDSGNIRIQKFLLLTNSCILSYNEPQLCANQEWNPNAMTFATSTVVGTSPLALFVDGTNAVYMINKDTNRILVQPHGSINVTRTISGDFNQAESLFVSITGDIYAVTNSNRVEKWTVNSNISKIVMNVNESCEGLFVDVNNTLYCTLNTRSQVIKASLNEGMNRTEIAAGNGSVGLTPDTLFYPRGIYVDIDLRLYVADCENNRIQLFSSGPTNATTIVGSGSLIDNITLRCPTGITFDADRHLFIVDNKNARIVGSGPYGFRCLVGCPGTGSTSNQLNEPYTLAFDSYGNMFVSDQLHNRIQKFILARNSCSEFTTFHSTLSATTTQEITSMSHTTSNGSTSMLSTQSTTMTRPMAFVPHTCPDQNTIGVHCNISSLPCNISQPCRNNGNCTNDNTTADGYLCSCPKGFDGAQCQLDNRPCKPNTCWNNGTCNETSNTTFVCSCLNGWTDSHCETKINYCEGVKCENNAVCRPLFLNYTCECLGTSYSGRHCEIVATSRVIHQMVTRSCGYIAIICLVVVVSFFVIMDILKYCFGIDPTKDELEKIQRAKAMKRVKRRPVIQRFTYVNAPPERPPTAKKRKEDLNVEETAV